MKMYIELSIVKSEDPQGKFKEHGVINGFINSKRG